jgi:hypothetical protein
MQLQILLVTEIMWPFWTSYAKLFCSSYSLIIGYSYFFINIIVPFMFLLLVEGLG